MYLWLPKLWTWIQFKNVLWFRRGLTPKARDFNWHNVIGIWSAIPLAIVVAGAVPISYPWASNLVYRIVGDAPPPPPAANPQARPAERAPVTYVSGGVDAAWAASQAQIPHWRTMTTRLATSAKAPVSIAVDEGYGGQPQLRTTFTFDRATGSLEKAENFKSLSSGRRLRSWLRFAHTGEIYGLTGQTIAGLVSAGAVVLVYTGIALALRRLAAWIGRRRDRATRDSKQHARRLMFIVVLVPLIQRQKGLFVMFVRTRLILPRKRKQGAYRLFATSALVMSTAMVGKPTVAQQLPPATLSAPGSEAVRFDIPAGPLDGALKLSAAPPA